MLCKRWLGLQGQPCNPQPEPTGQAASEACVLGPICKPIVTPSCYTAKWGSSASQVCLAQHQPQACPAQCRLCELLNPGMRVTLMTAGALLTLRPGHIACTGWE